MSLRLDYLRRLLYTLSIWIMAVSCFADDVPCYSFQSDLSRTGTDLKPWMGFRPVHDNFSTPPWLGDNNETFEPLVVDGKNVGLPETDYWFKLCVSNTTNSPISLQLIVNPPMLNHIGFYPSEEISTVIQTGFLHPFESRANLDRQYNFDIDLAANKTATYHLSVRHPNLPLSGINADLWTTEHYLDYSSRDKAQKFVHFGIFVALFLYHLFLYAMTREKTLLFFILASSSGLLTFYSLNGLVFQYLLYDLPQWNVFALKFIAPFAPIFAVLYIVHFLRLPQTMTSLTRRVYWVLALSCITLVSLWPSARWYLVLTYFGGFLIMPLFILGISTYCYFKKNKNSLYVLIAIFIPSIIYLLLAFGISDWGYGLEFALTSSMLLFSFGMGHQINQSKKEKEQAQQREHLQLVENVRLKEDHNAELEVRIKSRTEEIEKKTRTLEYQTKQLRAVDKMKSEFFSNISHEFRTPLTLIQGPLEQFVAHRGDQLPANYHAEAGIALRNTKQLSKLIEQLLELAKIEAKRQVIRVSEMDICQFAREQAAQFTSLSDNREIQLSVSLPTEPILLYFDFDKMQKIINNLLSNALKFTKSGGEVSFIVRDSGHDQETTGADAYVEMIVMDTGVGIPDRDIAHVFDRFYQGGITSNYSDGTGIGLALVNELLTLHGGSIQLQSKLNLGSTFTLWFPKGCDHFLPEEIGSQHAITPREAEGAATIVEHPLPSAIPTVPKEKQHTVLIVDDNADMRSHLEHGLMERYTLLQAQNGVEGLEMASHSAPDIIVSDVMMPEMDGISFLKEIRNDPRLFNIPVILLTALATQKDRFMGLRAQADDYLIKPFNIDELTIRIDNLIEKHRRLDKPDEELQVSVKRQLNHPADTEKTTFIAKLKHHIETHMMDENFNVDYLASAMFMSKATLYRHVESAVSTSPGMLIRECRMRRARLIFNAADSTYRSIEQVAAAVGIKKTSYFTRLYRKVFNEAPGFPEKVH